MFNTLRGFKEGEDTNRPDYWMRLVQERVMRGCRLKHLVRKVDEATYLIGKESDPFPPHQVRLDRTGPVDCTCKDSRATGFCIHMGAVAACLGHLYIKQAGRPFLSRSQ